MQEWHQYLSRVLAATPLSNWMVFCGLSQEEKRKVWWLIVIALESLQRLERNRIQLTFLCNVPTNLSGNSLTVVWGAWGWTVLEETVLSMMKCQLRCYGGKVFCVTMSCWVLCLQLPATMRHLWWLSAGVQSLTSHSALSSAMGRCRVENITYWSLASPVSLVSVGTFAKQR